eukprot:CAMPEP_0116016832 /NCGR_PEP_ID=MMETSP0321-20121206/7706_1 /TAXON_ID=163516 /ORGANISM="Leptocylindrus danicus var. danicus, Strain B650" /LENGTH=154 /DNA_ID=CAMNT_0003486947 /DNA_START=51 /DNA_END=515 /DNA_ORIENTATION=-
MMRGRVATFLMVLNQAIFGSSSRELPYALGVRDSFMIGHSFRGNPDFGPAANMHGATYTCDVEFRTAKLHEKNNWVIDIGKALSILSDVLGEYNFKNLDEVFPDETVMTTTEFMAKKVHDGVAKRVKEECGFSGIITVKLWESHMAWASYEGKV